jgi:hypothetical protein
MITAVWRGIEAPRMEIAHVSFDASSVRAQGTQIGVSYELRYTLRDNGLHVEIVDDRAEFFALGDADFFDLGFSPLFNSLPVHRDNLLHDAGATQRDYTMLWVSVPDLHAHRSNQRYTPLGASLIIFSSGDYSARIEFDGDGLVGSYEGLADRAS